MEKTFILKVGQLYLKFYSVRDDRPETYFISSIEYTTNKDVAYVFLNEEQCKEIKKIIYLISGIELEVEETKEEL